MIELFSANTPNGWKISIMLEEIGYKYKTTPVDIKNDEQFNPEFIKISPFSKIPVIIDHDNNKESVFESGAILMYLAEQSGKLYEKQNRLIINQWLMAQMGLVGPLIGQYHSFYRFNKGKSKYGEERYFKITKDLYKTLNDRLSVSKYLAGEEYTIADIATWPWIARHQWHDIGLKNFKSLTRWYLEISQRESVKKGYQFIKQGDKIPQP